MSSNKRDLVITYNNKAYDMDTGSPIRKDGSLGSGPTVWEISGHTSTETWTEVEVDIDAFANLG